MRVRRYRTYIVGLQYEFHGIEETFFIKLGMFTMAQRAEYIPSPDFIASLCIETQTCTVIDRIRLGKPACT